jgi:serine/threonine-protein kinase RsbW
MQLTLKSDPIAVRNSLAKLLACPMLRHVDEAARNTAEIVLAEILNNIVEHAYSDQNGKICVTLHQQSRGISVVICDQGRAYPNSQVPQGTLPVVDVIDELPEGGFGWFLIRNLVEKLTYTRQAQCNRLSFVLPMPASATQTL